MNTHRTRAASPSTPRIYLDTPRASTGAILTSSFDSRYDTRPIRASFSAVPSTQSGRNGSVYETQPVSKRTYVDASHPGGTISRTEYAVRPRRDSASGDSRRPLNVLTKNVSPTRDRPEYTDSPRELTAYKPAATSKDDSGLRMLQPAHSRGSVHHQRHNSATRPDAGRYISTSAPRAERAYHSRGGPYVEKVADARPIVPRYIEGPDVEYTGPREQFDRDSLARTRRESLSRRERPSSALEAKTDPFRRETAPPSASRQLQRVERDDRRSGFESDPDRSRKPPRVRRPSHGPVVHQREEGYSSAREEYEPRRSSKFLPNDDDVRPPSNRNRYRDVDRDIDREKERPRREVVREEERLAEREKDKEKREKRSSRPYDREYERERNRSDVRDYEQPLEDDTRRRHRRRETRDSRDPSPERSGLKALATAAVGGLATAGILSKKSKDDEVSDSDSRREHRRRHRKSRDAKEGDSREVDDEELSRQNKDRRSRRDEGAESSGSDTAEDDKSRKRPQSRTRQRRDPHEGYESDREKAQLALPAPEMERRPSKDTSASAAYDDSAYGSTASRMQESPTNDEGRTISPGEGEDGRPRRVSIVDPGSRREDLRPKGILKKARAVPFPEDPNPQREGVAPLKQAGKEGIPVGARWTKVSRILVNPEALEKAHLRFEERDDYVIVLKVLSRQEIEKLAEKTKEIREHREREWSKQASKNEERETESDGDYDQHRREPLAIEPAPSMPPTDLRQLAAQGNMPQQQHAYVPQPNYQQQAYPAQFQQPYPPQQYPSQQSYPPQQQRQNPEPARSSAEAIAATAPGQPVPQQHQYQQPQQYDAGAYSQNV